MNDPKRIRILEYGKRSENRGKIAFYSGKDAADTYGISSNPSFGDEFWYLLNYARSNFAHRSAPTFHDLRKD